MGPHALESFVIGSSFVLKSLSDQERHLLDTAPWVFVCNAFLSHWEAAGWRPTVWCYGDNHAQYLIEELDWQLAAIATDNRLQERLTHVFVCKENFGRDAELAARRWGVSATYYRRGPAWVREQSLATSLDGVIYHHGSTFTDLVNLAWLLNPGQPIKLYGNEFGPGFGHFWQEPRKPPDPHLWKSVMECMWIGLADIHRSGVPLIDCNEHEAPLPDGDLPRGTLL